MAGSAFRCCRVSEKSRDTKRAVAIWNCPGGLRTVLGLLTEQRRLKNQLKLSGRAHRLLERSPEMLDRLQQGLAVRAFRR